MLQMRSLLRICIITIFAISFCHAQTLKVRTPEEREKEIENHQASPAPAPAPVTVDMNVPAGTPIKVALDSEVRVRRVGQPIHGKTMEPVYAFDKLQIPVGTTVTGKISGIDPVAKKRRILDAMDAKFSPLRAAHVQFDELVLADGRRLPILTVASPAPNGVLRFVPANAKGEKKNKVEDAASKKVSRARQQVRQQWSDLKKQIHEPGKLHKLERLAVRGWARGSTQGLMEGLERSITPTLSRYASDPRHLELVRHQCRQSVAEFVQLWLEREHHHVNEIQILFPKEENSPTLRLKH